MATLNKYTIIIPHKNIPKLLQRCLDSIPQRDDLEVIIVDDDSSPEIVDFEHFPGLGRKNTTVIFDKSGKGAGRARNIGLDHAKGKWLLFADADDKYEEGLNLVLNNLQYENEDVDIVYYGVMSRDSDTLKLTDDSCPYNDILNGRDNFSCRYKLLTPWIKATRKVLVDINHIRFEEIPCSNDTRFSALCGYYARNINVFPEIAYCWMQRNGSLWRNKNAEWCVTRYEVCLRLASFMKNINEKQAESYYEDSAWSYICNLLFHSPWKFLKGCFLFSYTLRDYNFWVSRLPLLFYRYFKAAVKKYVLNK